MLGTSLPAAEPVRLRVLSYNIHHGEGTDGELDLERIAQVINDARPDIVALQEVDIKTDRVGGIDEGAILARLTGMTYVPGENIDYQNGRYGNGVLVRGTVLHSQNHLLPPSSAEQRGVLDLRFKKDKDSPEMRFLATHLDHRPADDERLASAAFINALVKEDETPAILAGDLNDTPGSETLKRLGRQWSNPTAGKTLLTSPAGKPVRQIDYVLTRPGGAWRLVEARVLDEAVASDHRPIFVVLELRVES